MTQREGCFHDAEENILSGEGNNIFESNEPFRKDLVVRYALEWPSLTTQWLPEIIIPDEDGYSLHNLILGTRTSSNKQNYLMIASVKLPSENLQLYSPHGDNLPVGSEIKIERKINHEGEVIKACFMPQNPSIIATKTAYSEVLIFDYTKHPFQPHSSGICSPELILKSHHKEGYGLSWNPILNGYLISASGDHTICLWDMNAMPTSAGVINPMTIFTQHTSFVNDVAWHPFCQIMYGSVADDGKLMIWDTRSKNTSHIVGAHAAEVHCLAFNPYNEFILATGSADETIALWDLRYLNRKLYSFESYKDAPLKVQWAPRHQNVLAYSGIGKLLYVCDLSLLAEEQSAGSAPAMFKYKCCEHTAEILEFSWNLNEPCVISSVAEDNIVQIWQMSEHDYHKQFFNAVH
jgi:histone-binding protein RBBP4